MKLKILPNQEEYTAFVEKCNHSQFTQSWEWGELASQEGSHIFRFGVEKNNQLIMACTILLKKLFLGFTYLYAPRGPIFSHELSESEWTECMELFLSAARDICYQTTTTTELFIRFEPSKLYSSVTSKLPLKKIDDVQPSHEYVSDLSIPPDEFLLNCHKKLLYNARLAEKKNVEIRKVDDIQTIWHLLRLTAERHMIRTHSISHYVQMSALQTKNCRTDLWCAYVENTPIAGVVIITYGDTAYYAHGGSDHAYRSLMAPDLLHLKLIEHYRSQGYHYYNFGGVAPDGVVNHKLSGVTQFKKKFCGTTVMWPGTYDYIYDNFMYTSYVFIVNLKKYIRSILKIFTR